MQALIVQRLDAITEEAPITAAQLALVALQRCQLHASAIARHQCVRCEYGYPKYCRTAHIRSCSTLTAFYSLRYISVKYGTSFLLV